MAKRKAANPKDPRAGNTTVVRAQNQHLLRKRYVLPDGLSCKEFVMRELDARDELEAAMWADKKTTTTGGNNMLSMMGAEQREAMRLSFCEVDGHPVNIDGIPFVDFDRWTMKTMRFVTQAFNDLNGVDAKELKSFTAGAEVVLDAPTNNRPQAVAEDTTGARETA